MMPLPPDRCAESGGISNAFLKAGKSQRDTESLGNRHSRVDFIINAFSNDMARDPVRHHDQ